MVTTSASVFAVPTVPAEAKPLGTRQALVIGASMAGLLAARVLADSFARVTVIDRDDFPTAPDHRKGVPQSHHAPALLPRGQQIIGDLFPGLLDELRAAGAHSAYDVAGIAFVTPAGPLPNEPVPGEFLAFSRALLEWHVRRRLLGRGDVQVVAGGQVTGLMAVDGRVTGALLRWRPGHSGPETLAADLVVDASGRASRAVEWLVEMGYDAPPEETITSGLGYASRVYARPADFAEAWQGLIINTRPPHNPRAGLILPIEHGRWHVSLAGLAGHQPPIDEAGFLQWTRDLADPALYEAIRNAEPLTPIKGYGTPINRRRHFERLDRWPTGFIVTGDAVCAFNPIFGQGMTVSALDALVLADCLCGQRGQLLPGFERDFQRRLAPQANAPWLAATAEDLRWPGVTLSGAHPRGLALLHRYLDLVLRQATVDPTVTAAYLSVISMLAPPSTLARPEVLWRVLGGAVRRRLTGMAGHRWSSRTSEAPVGSSFRLGCW